MARYLIGVTGASGSAYAVDFVRRCPGDKYLVLSNWARQVLQSETGLKPADLAPHVKKTFADTDLAAPFSSGSNRYDAYVILPCTISTVARIAAGAADTLITRAAAVALKERMRMIVCVRETPLSTLALEACLRLSREGVTVMPISPPWYAEPKNLDDLVGGFSRKLLALLGEDAGPGWREQELEMSFRSLSEFLGVLERHGDLRRVTHEVDWACEVTEIACREAKAEGPALLFENVRGAKFPLAVNVLAATRRIEWALGRTARSVGAEIEEIFHALPPKEIGDLWGLRGSAGRILASRPQRIDRGPAQDFTLAAGLEPLPILQLWPRDGGRFVTFPLVLTEDPVTRKRNLGIYRMQVFDARTTGMHWQIGKGGGFHFHQAERIGQPLEVAVAVGADPATLLAAIAPLPEGIDELAFAGFLRGSSTRLARARTLSMRVPADAEFVIEGVVPPGERRTEGPFGDHFGHYSHAAPFPVFHVNAVTHRQRPVFQASVVGKPPQEDLWMGEAVQEMFTGVLKVIHPEIVDLWAYFEAGFHNLLVVAVDNRFAREAKKTALGLLGTGQLSLTKCAPLVDADVNPRDREAVFAALARNFDPAEDLLLIPGVPLDTLDFTSYTMNLGSKMVLDAQISHRGRPRGAEPANGRAPLTQEALADPRTFDERVLEWRLVSGGVLIVKVRGAVGGDAAGWEAAGAEAVGRAAHATPGRQVIETLVRRSEYREVPLIVAVSEDVALDDPRERLWGWFTRFDCARDVIPAAVDVRGAWLSVRGPLGIDATWKPGYPEPVANTPELVAQVEKTWGSS